MGSSIENAAHALQALVSQDEFDATAVAALLDGMSSTERVESIRSLSGREQRNLYFGVAGAAKATLEDLVPANTPPLTQVVHYGMNSLPLFRVFEKRFYRYEGGVAGANFQALSPVTGPGYFVVQEDPERGELRVDYNSLPGVAPEGWPPIKRNDRGVSRLVYGFMVDTLRRVSQHVTIGSAARHDKPMNSYFVLCREAAS